MKKIIKDSASSEIGDILNMGSEQQYTFFEWLQHQETEAKSILWLRNIREALSKFSMGIADGKELYKKYGKE